MGYVAATRQTFPSYWAPISLALYPAALVLVRCVGVREGGREGQRDRERGRRRFRCSRLLFSSLFNVLQHTATQTDGAYTLWGASSSMKSVLQCVAMY